MRQKPTYTVVEYRTDHGIISGLVKTDEPDRLLWGFTDRQSCIEQLRKKHARQYLLNGKITTIEPLPQNTPRYKRCKQWLEEFIRKISVRTAADGKPVYTCERKDEIEHCSYTDQYSLYLEKTEKGPVLHLHLYSGWNGSHWDYRTDGKPSDLCYIAGFCQNHANDILDAQNKD